MLEKIFDVTKLKEIDLQYAVHESVPFGILLAIVGGFLDAYTFISRGGVFANAQTGNIVLLGVYASEKEWGQALGHVPPIIAFVAGVIITEMIKKNSSRFFLFEWERLVLIFEIIVLFIIGFIPKTTSDIIVTVIISLVASIQVCTFRKLVDSPYSTTMLTGNLRSASQAAYIAITQKDYKYAARAIRYFIIIFSFIFGGFFGGITTRIIGVKAIWGAAIILVFAVILFNINNAIKNDEST